MPPGLGTKLVELKLQPAPPGGSAADRDSLAGVGTEVITSVRLLPPFPFRAQWIALITEFEWNHHFADIQKKGPFKSFHHRHQFAEEIRAEVRGTRIRDVIDYDVGFGWLGGLAEKLVIARSFPKTFHYRQRTLEGLLAGRPQSFT
jgi:ligand-binding SRPBCC domain-containing protein